MNHQRFSTYRQDHGYETDAIMHVQLHGDALSNWPTFVKHQYSWTEEQRLRGSAQASRPNINATPGAISQLVSISFELRP